jgi:hypothetical protein
MSIFQLDRHTGVFVQTPGANKRDTHNDREIMDDWNYDGSCLLT